MPGFTVYSPFDGAPVPAANEQVRDELVSVYGYHLEPPELGEQEQPAEEQPKVETNEPAVATPAVATPAEGQALEERGDDDGEEHAGWPP